MSTNPPLDVTPTGPVFAREQTIADVFAYAEGPQSAGFIPTVFATYVDHAPVAHPDDANLRNLVRYANGALVLSPDQKQLSARLRLWRNIDQGETPALFDSPAEPEDPFDDPRAGRGITITLSDSGKVTYQTEDLKPGPVTALNAVYDNLIYVETSGSGMRSLSFTLGDFRTQT